jgi:hypothetical protein
VSRTGRQRLDAIIPAIGRRDEFIARVTDAGMDAVRCADLMAEAITMQISANHLEVVSRGGKVTVSMEDVAAGHCMIAARDAYLKARGSNSEDADA